MGSKMLILGKETLDIFPLKMKGVFAMRARHGERTLVGGLVTGFTMGSGVAMMKTKVLVSMTRGSEPVHDYV